MPRMFSDCCTDTDLCQSHERSWKDQLQFFFSKMQSDLFECDYCAAGEHDSHLGECQSPDARASREASLDREFDERVALGYGI